MLKTKRIFKLLIPISLGFSLIGCGGSQTPAEIESSTAQNDEMAEVSILREELAALQIRAQKIKDSNDIKRLQRAYGYYVDEAMWDDIVDLFTEDATIEFALDGVYRGKEHIKEYLYRLGGGHLGLSEGELNEHFQLMPVVTLADDGMTAKGRWRAIIMSGDFGESATWGEGPYENEYVKEGGIWKISKLHWYETIMVPYVGGWGSNSNISAGKYVSGEFPPDEPTTVEYETWPSTFLPPFHFPNPVATYVPEATNEVEEGAQ